MNSPKEVVGWRVYIPGNRPIEDVARNGLWAEGTVPFQSESQRGFDAILSLT